MGKIPKRQSCVKAAALAALLALLAACATQAAPTPTPTASVDGLARWAAETCAIIEQFTVAIDAVRDDVDPDTLSLEERKARADRISTSSLTAIDAALERWVDVAPASGTETYQRALVGQLEAVRVALAEQAQAVAAATSAQDIETANASVSVVFSQTQARVDQAIEGLPGAAVTALTGVTRYGNLTPTR